jgi:Response regulator receiver domain
MSPRSESKFVAIVDDDDSVRDTLQGLLKSVGFSSRVFESAEQFLGSGHHRETACLITDIRMPGMFGLEFQARSMEYLSCPSGDFFVAHEVRWNEDALQAQSHSINRWNRRAHAELPGLIRSRTDKRSFLFYATTTGLPRRLGSSRCSTCLLHLSSSL